jgi:DNA-binding winged helix-turn-helix (wHTH) protein
VCLTDIRQALGDDVKEPQYVQTVGREGYRYIGPRVGGKPYTQQEYKILKKVSDQIAAAIYLNYPRPKSHKSI